VNNVPVTFYMIYEEHIIRYGRLRSDTPNVKNQFPCLRTQHIINILIL